MTPSCAVSKLAMLGPPAAAAGSGNGSGYGGSTDSGGYTAWGFVGAVQPKGGGGGGVRGCENLDDPTGAPAHYEWYSDNLSDGTGRILFVLCVTDGYTFDFAGPNIPVDKYRVLDVIYPLPDPVNVAATLSSVINKLSPVPPSIGSNPGEGGGETLVGLDTWFWVAGNIGPQTQTLTDGPVSVTLSTRPIGDVTFESGDGGSVACTLPTPPYDTSKPESAQSSDCTYRYRQPSPAYTVTARVAYTGTFTVSIGGTVVGTRDLGTVNRASTTTLRVAEGQAIVTGRG